MHVVSHSQAYSCIMFYGEIILLLYSTITRSYRSHELVFRLGKAK